MKHPQKTPGEPFVWLTGLGLSLGLIMVIGLLGLIIVNGFDVFWPKRVAEIEVSGPATDVAPEKLAGEVVLRREKLLHALAGQKQEEEWQVFTGNKEVEGQAFRFIDVGSIRSVTYPKNILSLERMEYGDAFGFPQELRLENGEKIPAENPQFNSKLFSLVRSSVKRWRQIEKIEKKQIGAINRKMERAGEAQKSDLQKRYQALADKARLLRETQVKDKLIYRLANGKEKELALGQILSFYYPNQLSSLQRVGLFFKNGWTFISTDPREANTEGGVFPAIFGTLVMTVLMSLVVVPFGVLAAVYLREYARQGWVVRTVRIAVNNLAGVPSIVFGVFGLGFFVYMVGGGIDHLFFRDRLPIPTFGTGGMLWAALTLALMTVPVVIVSTEEALAAVPRGMREGALACGASKWQAIKSVILPAAAPGILTGMILAMARGAGEVAPLMLVGVVKLAPSLPINGIFPYIHLDQKFMHLAFNIYDLGFQSPDSEAAKPMVFATTLLLIVLVVALNLGAVFLRERLRKKYAIGAF